MGSRSPLSQAASRMRRKQKRLLQAVGLALAALVFLPNVGLWALYRERQLDAVGGGDGRGGAGGGAAGGARGGAPPGAAAAAREEAQVRRWRRSAFPLLPSGMLCLREGLLRSEKGREGRSYGGEGEARQNADRSLCPPPFLWAKDGRGRLASLGASGRSIERREEGSGRWRRTRTWGGGGN